jgi:hypothetical protein
LTFRALGAVNHRPENAPACINVHQHSGIGVGAYWHVFLARRITKRNCRWFTHESFSSAAASIKAFEGYQETFFFPSTASSTEIPGPAATTLA